VKANYITVTERLESRIRKMSYRLEGAIVRKKGQFYMSCKRCDITLISLSIEGDHRTGCPYRGFQKQIDYYKRLLSEANSVETLRART